jgi:phosphopentomutase
MARGFLLILDSFGIGAAADADRFGDLGADTLGHIAKACAEGRADRAGLRSGPLHLPTLDGLGLGQAAAQATGAVPVGLSGGEVGGLVGYGAEKSKGKDTPSGHWELAGVPVPFDWGYFPHTIPTFPQALTDALIAEGGLPGVLGNKHASGTEIIAELGEAHMATGMPIVYTSADSVLQIAAHEETFGLQRLYDLCQIGRRLIDPLNIGRVIARPFVGTHARDFVRTANRRDYAVPPAEPTLLDRAKADGRAVIGIGKIADIYAHCGITDERKAAGNAKLFDVTMDVTATASEGALVVTNFVDFDMLYGHRRDPAGYAAALEAFDQRLPTFMAAMRPGDLAIITADHGCDPTWPGTDHTREYVPILAFGPGVRAKAIGRRGFADVGETLAAHLGLAPGRHGTSFLDSAA